MNTLMFLVKTLWYTF